MSDKEQSGTAGQTPDATGSGQEPGTGVRTFTQDELDAIIKARLDRDRQSRQPEYDALKAKAEKWAEYEEAQKSEVQKLQEAAQRAEQAKAEALRVANERLVKAEFIAAASQLGVKHPEDAFALADRSTVEVTDAGDVRGVADAVKVLVEAGRLPLSSRPPAPGLDGGAGSGERTSDTKPITEQERAIAAKLGLTPEDYRKGRRD